MKRQFALLLLTVPAWIALNFPFSLVGGVVVLNYLVFRSDVELLLFGLGLLGVDWVLKFISMFGVDTRNFSLACQFLMSKNYQFSRVKVESRLVQRGIDGFSRARLLMPEAMLKRWHRKGRVHKQLDPLHIIIATPIPSAVVMSQTTLVSFTSLWGPSVIICLENPNHSIYARFNLYHELSHVGAEAGEWSGTRYVLQLTRIATMFLVLLSFPLTVFGTIASIIVVVDAIRQLVSGERRVMEESRADCDALDRLYESGCSEHDLIKCVRMIYRLYSLQNTWWSRMMYLVRFRQAKQYYLRIRKRGFGRKRGTGYAVWGGTVPLGLLSALPALSVIGRTPVLSMWLALTPLCVTMVGIVTFPILIRIVAAAVDRLGIYLARCY